MASRFPGSLSSWVFLRVRPWIDSLSRKLVLDRNDDESHYVEETRAILARSTITTPWSNGTRGRRVKKKSKFPNGPS